MTSFVKYVLSLTILISTAQVYFKVAGYYNVVDKPNDRSSHSIPTIRGGGVIFIMAFLLFFLWNGFTYPYLLASIMVSGLVSFLDDVRTVNNLLKFGVHLLSVALLLIECNLFNNFPLLYLLGIGILTIGIINAYNFMDGINGITGLYSLAVIGPLFLTETDETLQSLELFTLMGLAVFNFYNSRKKARCFAGDVGSISIAIIIVFLLIMRILQTNNFAYIGMLMIYGIDTVYTILLRLYLRENIFKPHRKHLYQYFCNERGIPHLWISIAYALLQLLLNMAIVYTSISYTHLFILLIFLSTLYWFVKAPFVKILLRRPSSTAG